MIIIMQRTIDYADEVSKDISKLKQLFYLNSLWNEITKDNIMFTKNKIRYVKIEDEEA